MKWLKVGVLAAVLLSVVMTAPAPVPFADDPLRLPKSVVPTHYDLELTTNVDTGDRAFSGKVKIDVDILENVDEILLHNRGLVLKSILIKDESDVEITHVEQQEVGSDFVHFTEFSRPILKDEKLTLEIEFEGQLQLSMAGFYRSTYRENGVTR